jgi:tetratricopeptide (TPR) repeat protein
MTTDQDLRRVAEEHAGRGEWNLALQRFNELRLRYPGNADVLLQLSYVHSLAGDYRQAKELAIEAAHAAPTQTDQLLELIARLRTFNEVPLLRSTMERLRSTKRLPVPQLIAFAAQWSYLGDQPTALQLLDEAKSCEPGNPAVLLARGQVLTYLGRLEDAEADLKACLQRTPTATRAWLQLVGLRKQTHAANQVAVLRKLLAQPGMPVDAVADLGFALHKSLDDLGDYGAAWSALEQACNAKRSLVRYQTAETAALIDALIRWPTKSDVESVPKQGLDEAIPIFIVGMHRSGTTLLEQLLQGHSQVNGLGELYDFTCQMRDATGHHCRGVIDREIVQRAGNVDFEAVGNGYLKGVDWRLGREHFFIDKQPANFLNVGFICSALPQARILHMRRDPMETCFSNLRELFLDANAYSYDQRELAEYFLQYQRLMDHWASKISNRILDVDYAKLVTEPEAVLRDVARFCGISFEQEMLDLRPNLRGVATASAVAVRQSITAPDRPKWAAYARQLQPLANALRVD